MLLQILSDLHTCFFRSVEEVQTTIEQFIPDNAKEITLCIAGDLGAPFIEEIRTEGGWDTAPGKQKVLYHAAINLFTRNYKKVILIPGNHEYYGSSIEEADKWLWSLEDIYLNLEVLNNESYQKDDYLFIGSTLWFPYDDLNDLYWKGMTDCALNRTTLEELERKGEESARFIGQEVAFCAGNNLIPIVITHMAPSSMSITPRYQGRQLNRFYINEMAIKEIEWQQREESEAVWPVYWIHGHMHSFLDYTHPTGTRVICNPFGYFEYEENPQFKKQFIIEL